MVTQHVFFCIVVLQSMHKKTATGQCAPCTFQTNCGGCAPASWQLQPPMQQQEIVSDAFMPQGSFAPSRGGGGGFLVHHPPPPPLPPQSYRSKHSLSLLKHHSHCSAGRSCLNQYTPRWQDLHSHCESRQPSQYPAGGCDIRYGVLTVNTCKSGASCSVQG